MYYNPPKPNQRTPSHNGQILLVPMVSALERLHRHFILCVCNLMKINHHPLYVLKLQIFSAISLILLGVISLPRVHYLRVCNHLYNP